MDMARRALYAQRPPGERVVRLAVRVGEVDPVRWLRAQHVYPRSYWLGREDGLEVAAAGAADVYEGSVEEGPPSLHERLAPLLGSGAPDLRYYGGLRFDAARASDERWKAFGAYRFVLPRFELRARPEEPGGSVLVCNLVLPRDAESGAESLDGILDPLSFELPSESYGGLPVPVFRTDNPDWHGWKHGVERALSSFSESGLGKVVLARRTDFAFEDEPDPLLFVENLRAAMPDCFRFYTEPERGVAFLGATPERLFRRDRRSIRSEAVAGTRPRGESEADDDELREDLLTNRKDLSEHVWVRESIREMLEGLCDRLEMDAHPSEMKLAQGRHLVSRVRGRLREGVTEAKVLEALHPTPAVGGHPREEALALIRTLETFDRGWYAGPIGWIGAEESEFAVGIRSGFVRGRELSLFFGNGIVPGSTPEGEWEELEHKLAGFTKVFGLDPSHAAR